MGPRPLRTRALGLGLGGPKLSRPQVRVAVRCGSAGSAAGGAADGDGARGVELDGERVGLGGVESLGQGGGNLTTGTRGPARPNTNGPTPHRPLRSLSPSLRAPPSISSSGLCARPNMARCPTPHHPLPSLSRSLRAPPSIPSFPLLASSSGMCGCAWRCVWQVRQVRQGCKHGGLPSWWQLWLLLLWLWVLLLLVWLLFWLWLLLPLCLLLWWLLVLLLLLLLVWLLLLLCPLLSWLLVWLLLLLLVWLLLPLCLLLSWLLVLLLLLLLVWLLLWLVLAVMHVLPVVALVVAMVAGVAGVVVVMLVGWGGVGYARWHGHVVAPVGCSGWWC